MMCFPLAMMLMESIVCPGKYEPEPRPISLYDLPAIVVVYDPALGGINCDSDCTTIATGKLLPEMYGVIAACHPDLLWRTVEIAGIGIYECLDTGGEIGVRWSDHFQRLVLYFDILYDIVNLGFPSWAGMLIEDWRIVPLGD